MLQNAIGTVARYDPETAIAHLDALPAAEQSKGVALITRAWQENDPGGTFEWLYEQPDIPRNTTEHGDEAARDPFADDTGMDLNRLIQETSKAWVLANPLEASEAIGALESETRLDHAVAGMVHGLISRSNPNKDFTAASAWTETIADDALKSQSLNEINKRQGIGVGEPGLEAGAGGGVILEVEADWGISIGGGIEIR